MGVVHSRGQCRFVEGDVDPSHVACMSRVEGENW